MSNSGNSRLIRRTVEVTLTEEDDQKLSQEMKLKGDSMKKGSLKPSISDVVALKVWATSGVYVKE